MVLVERGLVELDAPVNDYLGEARLTSHVGDPHEVTVRRLLLHAAGLPSHVNIFFERETARPPDQDESIRRYGIVVDEPGREFVYSNFGYGVLDRVISAVAGTSYREFMETEVFGPLGLVHTSVLADSALGSGAVRHYDALGNPFSALDFDHRGASAVHSSVHDLVRYGMFHLGNAVPGGQQILSDATLRMLQEPSPFAVSDQGAGDARSGLGWVIVDVEGVRIVVATGGMPGTQTRLALVPEENAVVAIMTNRGNGGDYSLWEIEWQTLRALIAGFPEPPQIESADEAATPVPAELYGEWRGSIRTHAGDLPAGLIIRDGRDIALQIAGTTTVPLRAATPLGGVSFEEGVLQGPFFGAIPTDDARRSRHVLFLRLRRRADTLSGVVSAIAVDRTFWLPHWIELKRVVDR